MGIAALPACSASETSEDETEEEGGAADNEGEGATEASDSALTESEKVAKCNAIQPTRWTQADFDKLLSEVVTRYVDLKRRNDGLVAQRGVGTYAGVRTDFWKAIAAQNKPAAVEMLRTSGKLKPGADPVAIVNEMSATSCIGRVYAILKQAYGAIGREREWATLEACGRAYDSEGLRFQQALIKSGWPSPAIAVVSDDTETPIGAPGGVESPKNKPIHEGMLVSIPRGVYMGVPISKSKVIANFLPTSGGQGDTRNLIELGRSTFLGVGTLRAGYHVPIVVPARLIPDDLAPRNAQKKAVWLRAKANGEPFVMESHSMRQPWDATNFEIRPLSDVIRETLTQSAVYSTGTILMAPNSEYVVPR